MAFAAAIDALFADPNMGVDGVWTPVSGTPLAVRLMRIAPDTIQDFGAARFTTPTTVFDVRVSQVAAPRAGDRIAVGTEHYLVQGEPQRDTLRLVWRVDTRPAP